MITSPLVVKNNFNPYSLIMFNFIPKKILDYNIYALGKPGEWGYGIATAPDNVLPEGFSGMSGHDDINSDNYGNYTAPDGSIMCWIPKFFYRCEGAIIDIKDIDYYLDKESAKRDGYVLHRAFVDGGVEVNGFFIDKYLNGVSDVDVIPKIPYSDIDRFIFNNIGNRNSLRDFRGEWFKFREYFGHFYQFAIKKRGSEFSSMSAFNMGALLMLMNAHANNSTTIENNAWYMEDPLNNHVKGPVEYRPSKEGSSKDPSEEKYPLINDEKPLIRLLEKNNYNRVWDPHDPSIIFREIQYPHEIVTFKDEFSNKMNHNGQYSGVNGIRAYGLTYSLGLINSFENYSYDLCFLKSDYKLSDITVTHTNTLDDCPTFPTNKATLDTYYTIVKGILDDSYTSLFYGNAENNVFSNDSQGDEWIKTGAFIPLYNGCSNVSNLISQKYFADFKISLKRAYSGYVGINCYTDGDNYVLGNTPNNNPRFLYRGVLYPHVTN